LRSTMSKEQYMSVHEKQCKRVNRKRFEENASRQKISLSIETEIDRKAYTTTI